MADKLKVSDAKKDKALMKKIDQLPKKEQTKWLKTYVSAYNYQIGKGEKAAKAKEYGARTAWDNVEVKYLESPTPEHGPKKRKKPLAANKGENMLDVRKAYTEDRLLLKEAGEEVAAESVEDFLMWCDAKNIVLKAAEGPEEVEFNEEEQAVLKDVVKAEITRDDEKVLIKLIADEDNFVEIEVGEEKDMEEEREMEVKEVMEEGVE